MYSFNFNFILGFQPFPPMRSLPFKLLSKSSPLIPHLPPLSSTKTLIRSFHESPPNPNPNPNPNHETLPSRIIQPIPTTNIPPNPETEEDATMNEFLSRFVHSIRPKLSEAYPDLPRETRDSMLLIICQNVVNRLNPAATSTVESPIDLSDDLWHTISDVSTTVNEAMRRDRVRTELRKYLHSDEVKQMCRFAGEVGIRGGFLRELRFKWAKEKMEEVEFYRELEKVRVRVRKEEEMEKGLIEVEEEKRVLGLPERKGRIEFRVCGLDMSDAKWAEVSERLEEAEKSVVGEEVRVVVGRSRRVEDRIMAVDLEKGDLKSLFREFEEALGARRVDWLALLGRIKGSNEDLYFKVWFLS